MSFAGIALIGLRGAGKSTLGKMLAKKIGWNFVELNKEIEAQNGLSVAEIIALYGQEGFRRMEQAALGQLLARKELMVLATGGGIVSEPLTFDLILSSFYTIWLKAEPEEHMARVRSQGDLRPMADDRSAMAELRTILLSREPLYARASAVVDTAGLSVDTAAARLIDAVAPVLHKDAQAFGLRNARFLKISIFYWMAQFIGQIRMNADIATVDTTPNAPRAGSLASRLISHSDRASYDSAGPGTADLERN